MKYQSIRALSPRALSLRALPLSLLLTFALNATAQAVLDPAVSANPIKQDTESGTNSEQPVVNVPYEARGSSDKDSVDPWQGYNRAIFSFNSRVDKHLIKPLAKAYVKTTPAFFRRGVSNVFANVTEVPSALNNVLQGKLTGAARNSGRLLVNSTLGVAGLFDVAQHMGLQDQDDEDFGQTLAVWGVDAGPYLVLPFLGPSTLRDGAVVPVDWYSDPKTYIDHVPTKNTVRAFSILSMRANFLPVEKTVTGDKYVFIRDAYLQRRNFLINDGQVEDSFGTEEAENGDYGY